MANRRRLTVKDIMSGKAGSFLVLDNFPFIIFLAFLATIYIANSRYAERNLRQIQVIQKEVKELNYEYMSLKSKLMQNSMQSEVAEKVAEQGLKELTDKPYKIVVKKKDFK